MERPPNASLLKFVNPTLNLSAEGPTNEAGFPKQDAFFQATQTFVGFDR